MAGLEAGFGKREGEAADLGDDPLGIALAGDELAEDPRVELVLGDQHAGGERVGGVAGQHRDRDLAEDRARIDRLADQMDGGAGNCLARRQNCIMGLETRMTWQQRWVDVDYSTGPAGDELGRNDPHEAGERDGIDRGFVQCSLQIFPIGYTIFLGIQSQDWDALGFGQREARRVGIVAGDQCDLIGAVVGAGGVDQRGHVRSASRDEDRDSGAFSHDGWRTSRRARSRFPPSR